MLKLHTPPELSKVTEVILELRTTSRLLVRHDIARFGGVSEMWQKLFFSKYNDRNGSKLQAAVYLLPPTTAVTGYAIGLQKLSAKRQFFIGAQMAVCL